MHTAFWEIIETVPEHKSCLVYIIGLYLVADVHNLCMGALTEDFTLDGPDIIILSIPVSCESNHGHFRRYLPGRIIYCGLEKINLICNIQK